MIEFIETTILSQQQKESINALWNTEYPVNLRNEGIQAFEAYLDNLSSQRHILLTDKEKLLGWYFEFDREGERWFSMILDSGIQGLGYGSKLLNLAKNKNTILNGWVIDHNDYKKDDGSVYSSPLTFYEKNDFQVISQVRIELDNISAVKVQWVRS